MSGFPKAEAVLDDIRSDMIDSEIMHKYRITAKELRVVYRELFESRAVEAAELYCRPVYWDNNIDSEPRREFPRLLLAFILPVHDAENPQLKGIVADVTEKGMKLEGLETEVGQKRKLVVNPSRFGDLDPIEFEAECRWNSKQGMENKPVAGFKITDISEAALHELRRFIRFVTTGRTGMLSTAMDHEKIVDEDFSEDKVKIQPQTEETTLELKAEESGMESENVESTGNEVKPDRPAVAKKEPKFNVSFNVNSP